MSISKINDIVNRSRGVHDAFSAGYQVARMLKIDYGFEFPREFNYKKCSKNRRGDEVAFSIKNDDGRICYVYKEGSGCHDFVIVDAMGRNYEGGENPLDLIMDEQETVEKIT